MPPCGNAPYLSFPDPFLYSLLIIQDPIQGLAPLRGLSWAPAAFIPKLEPHFNSIIPQQAFPAFTITIFLSIYLLMCLSHIKGKDRACFTLICPISRISSVTEQTINWTDLNCTKTPLWPPQSTQAAVLGFRRLLGSLTILKCYDSKHSLLTFRNNFCYWF